MSYDANWQLSPSSEKKLRDNAPWYVQKNLPKNSPGSVYPEHPRHGKPWLDMEEQFLRRNHKDMSVQQLSHHLGRFPSAISIRLDSMGLLPNTTNTNVVVIDEITEIRSSLPDLTEYKSTMTTSNIHRLLTLLQRNYTTVTVSFQPKQSGPQDNRQTYTYKIHNTGAACLRKMISGVGLTEPMVVVPYYQANRDEHGFKLAWVVRVDDEPEIDVSRPYELKWVVDVVEMEAWEDQMARELQVVQDMKKAQRMEARKRAEAELMALFPNAEEVARRLNGDVGGVVDDTLTGGA